MENSPRKQNNNLNIKKTKLTKQTEKYMAQGEKFTSVTPQINIFLIKLPKQPPTTTKRQQHRSSK
jgi:hypothetical protein